MENAPPDDHMPSTDLHAQPDAQPNAEPPSHGRSTHQRKMPVRKKRFGRNLTKGHPDQKLGKTSTTKHAIAEAAAAWRIEGATINSDCRLAARKPTVAEMRQELSKYKREVITSEKSLAQATKTNEKQAEQINREKNTQMATAALLKQSREKNRTLEKQICKAEPKLSTQTLVEQNTMLNTTVAKLHRENKVCDENY